MAADILLYKSTAVPVGEDQVQHVELSRLIAKKFNSKFGQTFPEPQTYLRKPLRIMSLSDPTKKMSKTGDESLLLDDSLEEMKRKLKKAVTASNTSGENSPGVDNLLLLMENFSPLTTKKYFADKQAAGLLQYSELKETLATDIFNYFEKFREKKKELLAKPDYLAEVLGDGASKARKIAGQTLLEVKQKIGLL
jgi:tryptophanyl-tRNA synthetase